MITSEKFSKYVLPTYARFPFTAERGDGVWLWDDQGKRYLDFCCGIAVCSLGHCHPRLTKTIQDQAANLLHCSNLYQIPQQADLAELIVEKCVQLPGKIFFANSGAEANDGLIKLARKFGHARPNANGDQRFEIITLNKSFHGRTIGSMSATGQDKIQKGFEPLLPGFIHVNLNKLEDIEAAITDKTVAVLLEPIQGESGIHSTTAEFLRGLAQVCKKHDMLLLFDEVQSGFGRTGNLMAWRTFAPEIEPDGISWAKGMGGGFPIGAFWASDRIIDTENTELSSIMGPGSHGSTYGGNPLASSASLAVISEILDSDLTSNAAHQEKRIREAFAQWELPIIHEIRGSGLLLGWALNTEDFKWPAETTPAVYVVNKLMAAGLLTVPAGLDTVRWLPPLNVSDSEIDQALQIMKVALIDITSTL